MLQSYALLQSLACATTHTNTHHRHHRRRQYPVGTTPGACGPHVGSPLCARVLSVCRLGKCRPGDIVRVRHQRLRLGWVVLVARSPYTKLPCTSICMQIERQ